MDSIGDNGNPLFKIVKGFPHNICYKKFVTDVGVEMRLV